MDNNTNNIREYKHIDAEALAAGAPPPSRFFVENVMTMVYAKSTTDARPMRRKVPSVIMVAALILVVLTAAAVAIGLSRSKQSDVVNTARQAMISEYGFTPTTLAVFGIDTKQDGDTWTVTFTSIYSAAINPDKTGIYEVAIKNGMKPEITWTHGDAEGWTPAQIQMALEKQRADLLASSANNPYVTPTPKPSVDTLDETDRAIVRAADRMMAEKYKMAPETINAFSREILRSDDLAANNLILVRYSPSKEFFPQGCTYFWRIGEYTVSVDAKANEAVSANWDNEHWDAAIYNAYGKDDWANAPIYPAQVLPYVIEFTETLAPILAKYPADATVYDMGFEDAAAFMQLYRDAGFSETDYPHRLPKEGELQYDAAIAIARQALIEDMNLTNEKLDASDLLVMYYYPTPGVGQWMIQYQYRDDKNEVGYTVILDAQGEILQTLAETGANG